MFKALLALALFAAAAAQAQQEAKWPTRPVRMEVPFTLGGATDIVARILAPAYAELLGEPFIVENRPGGAGNIGVELVAKSSPDGHMILVGNISTNAINPTGFAATLKFDPVKDLAPVTLIASIPTLLVAGAAFPPNSMKELIEYARARPGELNYSNPIGAYSHLDTLDLSARTGMQLVHVPSKGGGTAVAPLLSGEIHFSFLNAASVMPHIKAGKLKVYATTAMQRLPELPEVPTMAEAGFPGVGSVNWNGLFVPAKTPRAVIQRLFSATTQVMQRPPIRDAFNKASVPITLSASPEEFQEFVLAEVRRWAKIIRDNHVRLE